MKLVLQGSIKNLLRTRKLSLAKKFLSLMLSEVNQIPGSAKSQFHKEIRIVTRVVLFTDTFSATHSKRLFFHVTFGKTSFLFEHRNSVRRK